LLPKLFQDKISPEKNMKLIYLVPFFILIVTMIPRAQEEDSSLITLNKIYGSNYFRAERFGPTRWLDDGTGYTTLEPSGNNKGGDDIVSYDAASGTRKILVPSEKLIPMGQNSPLDIDDYQWSSDKKQLLIFTNSARVWRRNTRGDYWVLNMENWQLFKIGGNAPSSTLMFAKFSPDETRVAYVMKNNLYVQDLSTYNITQLTNDGSVTIINGTFDWVYEEELDLRDGFRWSPDGKSIAYWQLDAGGVRDFLLIDDTDSLYSFVKPVQYPVAGTTNSSCKVGIVDAAGGPTIWMKVPGDPRNNYIARMDWAAGSDEIILQHLNREQNKNEIILANAKTGNVKTLFVEQDSAWVDINDDLQWFKSSDQFVWVSERDGWRHVYIVSKTTGELKLITPGDFDVISIENIDEINGWIYFIASPDNASQRYLYRMAINGTGKPVRISPRNEPGTHSYQVSPNSDWAIHTYSAFSNPPVVDIVHLPDHKVSKTLVSNLGLKDKLKMLKVKPVEFFKVNIGGGVLLDGYCIKPYNFDPSKKYPVLFYVYGEPAAQTVLDEWERDWFWHEMLAQEGYIIISVDNRGTPGPRGREWRKSIYKKIGIISSEDQSAAAAELLKEWPFLDPDRIAVWGWSGGGSGTLDLLFRYPDIYKTGMSVAPVTDQRYYDSIYQERYMGLPQDNTEAYVEGSPITYADKLKGNLLIVHGSGDDNVHFQNTEALVNKLISLNKPFTMMDYPNRSHGIFEGNNTRLHLYSLLTRYLNEHEPVGAY
jgi:dipeptidyl-peptidase-4